MIELDNRFVFHIPLSKFVDGSLIPIEIDELIDDLIAKLAIESYYITAAESFYSERSFDELLLTVFSSEKNLGNEFRKWFIENNDALGQEAFAYEHNNRMIIESLR